jgi:hypothetical protein
VKNKNSNSENNASHNIVNIKPYCHARNFVQQLLTWNDMRLGRATNVPNNQTITIIILARNLDAKYLGFFSSRSLKMREKYISFA